MNEGRRGTEMTDEPKSIENPIHLEYHIRQHVRRRAELVAKEIKPYVTSKSKCVFYVAGGCLAGPIADIDLFPGPADFPEITAEKICTSRNATTYKTGQHPIQVCNYRYDSLRKLLESFDYAHIQVGAELTFMPQSLDPADNFKTVKPELSVTRADFTDRFILAHTTDSTWYCGSEYPLSSMIRAGKYQKKGVLKRSGYIKAVLNALVDVLDRGFKDYEDFKDQLDAVDLGLVPEELEDIETANLAKLYEHLTKDRK